MGLFNLAFETGARRRPDGMAGLVTKIFAASIAVWVVYGAAFSRVDALSLTIIFLALMLVLSFLVIAPRANPGSQNVPIYDWALALAAGASGLYFAWHADDIAQRITLLDPLSYWDVAFASIIILLTLEAVRRTVGLGLTVIVVVFIAYNLFGDKLLGLLGHGEITTHHFLDIMVFTTDGLFGVPLRVAGTYVFFFVLFGTLLAKTGGANFFFNLAASISGRSPGGPAKIAVISSALYGTISGSPTSDVVTTGAVTIPMMKRLGYNPALAGAVEVAASTGGSLLPPVMGAAAFIMAEYTGIPYVEIVIAAIIPALLYYLPVYAQVHLRALSTGLRGMDDDSIPAFLHTLRDGGLFLVPLAAICIALLQGYTPTYAALYGTIAVAVVSMLKASTRLTPRAVFDVLAETSLRMVSVAGACAAAGLVIGGITMTGLAAKFSHLVFLVAHGNVFASLLVAALLTIILGLGMPTPSAYILAAVLVAPVMANLGVDVMAGHLFLLYFAVMSALTPPVAVAAYAASAIADENPLKIAVYSVRLAIGAFLVPFSFVFNHALLMKGTPLEIAFAVACVASGLLLVAVAVEGYFRAPLRFLERLLVLGAGVACLFTSLTALAAAALLLGAASLTAKARPRTQKAGS